MMASQTGSTGRTTWCDRERVHFSGDAEGAKRLFEAVEDRGELVAIRQVVIDADGVAHRYSWRRREDENGGLSEQAITSHQSIARAEAAEFVDARGD
jgi:hypothetical protein